MLRDDLEVVPITWRSEQRKRGNAPHVDAGTRVWAIRHKPTSMFFPYAYLYEGTADRVMSNLSTHDYRAHEYVEEPRRVATVRAFDPTPETDDGTQG